jgi:DNA-binding NtrC family response regulator
VALILVVDDDDAVRHSLERILRVGGHEAMLAASGADALRVLDEHAVDVVLTDINMPEMDGIELLMLFQERAPDMPVIAISGGGLLDKGDLLEDAGALGAAATLSKPFEIDDVLAAVAEVLEAE